MWTRKQKGWSCLCGSGFFVLVAALHLASALRILAGSIGLPTSRTTLWESSLARLPGTLLDTLVQVPLVTPLVIAGGCVHWVVSQLRLRNE
jgi:hypothetical protein